jgi:hypothetical protein
MQKRGRALTQLPGLKPEYARGLGRLWLTTVEDVAGIIRLPEIEGNVSRDRVVLLFANELAIPFEVADSEVIQVVRNAIPDNEWYAMAGLEEPLAFGLLLEGVDQTPSLQIAGLPAPTPEELPSQVNLMEQFPNRFCDIRDQEQRGTCVAFAVTALHEYVHRQSTDQPIRHLSEEFLYWAARNRQHKFAPDTCHQCGTYLEYALQALLEMGQCKAEDKPYRTELPCNLEFAQGDIEDHTFVCYTCDYGNKPAYLATGAPDSDILTKAMVFRLTGWKAVKLKTIRDIKYTLYNKECPVVVGVPVYLTWQSPTSRHSGIISLPFQREIDDYQYHLGWHALLIVGYEDDKPNTAPPTPGGGYFIVRNSWGRQWGDASPAGYPVGHGMIPYAYLTRQFVHAYTLQQQ